jgi:hypothetical protein
MDGTMDAVRLPNDLEAAKKSHFCLFKGSDAPYLDLTQLLLKKSFVTDAVASSFKTESGKLVS